MKGLLIFVILFFGAWDLYWYVSGVSQTLPWRLKSMIAKGPAPFLLDVRTPAEFAAFHIPGARNMPDVLTNPEAQKALPADRPVVVICMTGHRSPPVVKALADKGLKNVSNLTWGMLGWFVFGGSTEKGGG